MNEIALPERSREQSVAGAQAWRMTLEDVENDRPTGTVVREPRYAAVNVHPVEVDAALADSEDADDKSILVICVPTGGAVPADLERNVELWISRCSYYRPAVCANIRTNRVVWADTRAIIYASPDQSRDTFDAVLRFTLTARETSALEKQMRSIWPTVDKHAPLSHAVTLRQGHLQPQISKMTEAVTRMKISYLLIQSAIQQTDPSLSSASKRLYAELVLQAGIHDRLDILDEPIQFLLDHYELANTRLIEHKSASIEILLTGLIVILLLVQTAVILVPQLSIASTAVLPQ